VSSLILLLSPDYQLFSDDGSVVGPAPTAGGRGVGERQPLAAVALYHYALRRPSVGCAERHVFGLVASFEAFDHHYQHHLPFPFYPGSLLLKIGYLPFMR
jgi:hypothetical protein